MKIKEYLPAIAFGVALGATSLLPVTGFAQDAANVLTRETVLRDQEIPDMGNPKGDVTIVEYFDYQCPYCKKVAPVLEQVARDDGKIRIVKKDWPIFGAVSIYAARMALASKFQGKHADAYRALISASGKLTEPRIREILKAAGIDLAKATADLQSHQEAIDRLLARNNAQAEALGFQGTPSFIVGTFRVPGVLDADGFRQAIADARAAAAKR